MLIFLSSIVLLQSWVLCSVYHLKQSIITNYIIFHNLDFEEPQSYNLSNHRSLTNTQNQAHPFSTERIFQHHQSKRRLESCGDSTAQPCYDCISTWGSKYCRYTKAFKMYKCCAAGDNEGICSSKDSEVLCTDSLQSYLKY